MKGKPTKVTVTWGIKWPGPVDYSTLSPEVTIERSIGSGERYEDAFDDAHSLALQSMSEALLEGIKKMKGLLDEENKRLSGR